MTVDAAHCVGCGRCIAVCPRDAIRVNWDETVTNLNRKIAEYAQAVVDGVNTLPPGSSANVSVSFDGTNVHFTFDIPQGSDGATGAQGQPGEVSQTDLNNGLLNNLSQCSNKSNGVSTLGQGADGSYNQSQM